jgi:hypothetical protein
MTLKNQNEFFDKPFRVNTFERPGDGVRLKLPTADNSCSQQTLIIIL